MLAASATYAEAENTDGGLRLAYAPKWSGNFNLSYTRPWSDTGLEWKVDAQVNYRSEQFTQSGETFEDGSLTLVDLRLALASRSGWELALLGRNLFDESSSFGFDFPYFGGLVVPAGEATIGSVTRPRTLALQARYTF
jgi:iron complex outermembrane receptor protein